MIEKKEIPTLWRFANVYGTPNFMSVGSICNANRLTSVQHLDPISGFPNLKSLRCRVRKL
ncbi:MAG: hypothetical protein HN366_10840 [Deltaproteobacteria bacterium]|jgi:hypothetical protein|nr:hypothetical protein [Deltaproteobacteria bacterium]